jgi:hypothetical protein
MSEDDWCHQVLKYDHGHSLERLSQLVKIDRKTMPLIAHVYVKDYVIEGSHSNSDKLIQIIKETKFSYLCKICTKENNIKRVELLKKFMDKKTIKDFRVSSIGASIYFDFLKELEDGTIRAKLKEWK